MLNRFDWYVRQDFSFDGVAFYAKSPEGERREYLTATLTVNPHEPGMWTEPTMRLSREEAQQLMNGLWQEGFRPKDGAGALAHVETLKAHLDDLRTVAWHALKITK